jgi:hypothetical protein
MNERLKYKKKKKNVKKLFALDTEVYDIQDIYNNVTKNSFPYYIFENGDIYNHTFFFFFNKTNISTKVLLNTKKEDTRITVEYDRH